jgi:CheY-like chemotaxis protein
MSKEQSEHQFEPFNRLGRERGVIEGSGIGLALTRELVRLMKGQMDVESEVGRGTRVRLALPASRTFSQDQRPVSADETQEPLPMGVVLYIEDNPVNMLLVEHMLASWSGVRLVKAEDGGSGIELARSVLPDLILLDMQLPDMHGIDVLEALRADDSTRHLRVVALSASAMPEDVERALRFGAADYWTKPLDLKRFLRNLRRLLPAEVVAS